MKASSVFLRNIVLTVFLMSANDCAAKEDYIAYHKAILHCERAFLFDNDIPKALSEYRKVVASYKKPFAKDCLVALQLACYSGDKEAASFFLQKAFSRGLDWAALGQSVWISKMLAENAMLKSSAEAAYSGLHAQFLESVDKGLRQQVIDMKNLDDSLKAIYNGKPREEFERLKVAHRRAVDSNTVILAQLTNKYGFLGDNRIGFLDYGFDFTAYGGGNVEEVKAEYCYQMRSLVDQLYFHQGCCYFMAPAALDKALHDGEVTPGMYAMIYEWAHDDVNSGRPEMNLCQDMHSQQEKMYRYGRYLVQPSTPGFDTAKVNRYRDEISLASVEHAVRKSAYAKEHNMRLFFGMFNFY